MMLHQNSLLSTAIILAITEIPLASPFSSPPLHHYSSRRHAYAFHPHQYHDDDSRVSMARRNHSPQRRIVDLVGGRISWHASSLDSTASPTPLAVGDNTIVSASDRIENCKRDLIQECDAHESGNGKKSSYIENKIVELEQLGVELGFGLESSFSGLLSGEW